MTNGSGMTDQPEIGARTIRPSSLVTAQDCGARWAARHYAAAITDAGYHLHGTPVLHVGAAVGSGVHAGAAFTLEAKRTTGELGNATEAEDRAVAEFQDRAQFGVSWDATTDGLPTAQKQLARMTRSFRRHLAPALNVLQVETRLTADAGNGWEVSGQVDMLCGDPDSVIEDLKTGHSRRANGAQYGAYASVWRAHGYQVQGVRENFLARVKLDKEQPPPERHDVDLVPAMQQAREVIEDIMRQVAEFDRRVVAGDRPPHLAFRANPASQLCSARFCPAWGTDFCTAHRR